MIDLAMLITPVLAGLFLGQAAYICEALGWKRVEPGSWIPQFRTETAPESTSASGAILWAQIEKESANERLRLAGRALDAIPDVSCDAVAEAFDLPPLRVRRLSSPLRRKGKRVTETGTYTNEEIRAAAAEVAECPF